MNGDIRAESASGALLLVWLPANNCLALLAGPPGEALSLYRVIRLYRTKDDAWDDWRRITTPQATLTP